jgi:hypothetical protein
LGITVTKISDALYVASVTPPDVAEPWSTAEPVRMHVLSERLLHLGLHQVNVGDAIDQADRNWIREKQNRLTEEGEDDGF